MAKALKQMLSAQLQQELSTTTGCLVLDTGAMTVEGAMAFRRELREKAGGARLRVVHNRTARLAIEQAWLKGTANTSLRGLLKGSCAIVFGGGGPVPSAKVVVEYRKKFKPLQFKGAVADGEVLGAKDAEALSKLPGLLELRGQLVGLLAGSARGMVATMHGVIAGLVRVLQARVDAAPKTAPEAAPEAASNAAPQTSPAADPKAGKAEGAA